MQRDRKVKKKVLLFLILLVAFSIAVLLGWKLFFEEVEPEWDDSLSQSSYNYITYEGHQYRYDTNKKNILFIGLDNRGEIRDDNIPGESGQADCIMLFTLDRSNETAGVMQIPRDTMTSIDVYDLGGELRTTVTEQLATQYAYSVGGKNGGEAMKKTVSELLYDLPIDGYLVMDMAAIPIVNDAIGGVTITIPEDYTRINPAFKKGETLTLSGQQAKEYVHYRDYDLAFSNNGRMQRQLDYVPALVQQIQKQYAKEQNYYKVLYPLVEKYMVTDMQEDEMNRLAGYQLDMSDAWILAGEGKMGEKYQEFYPDQEKNQKYLIETFYILKN